MLQYILHFLQEEGQVSDQDTSIRIYEDIKDAVKEAKDDGRPYIIVPEPTPNTKLSLI